MLFLILIVFGALAAIIWRSWIAGGIVVLVVLLLLGTYTMRATVTPATAILTVRETATPVGEVQEPSPEQLQTSDVFPSMDDAAINLAKRLCNEVCNGGLGQTKITRILIVTTDQEGIGATIHSVFRQSNPTAEMVVTDIHPNDAKALVITAKLEGTGKNKKLTLIGALDGQEREVGARVEDKPWVNHLDEYQGKHQDGLWLVAWSGIPAKTKEKARQQARQEAARELLPHVRRKYMELSSSNRVDDDWLRRNLEQELQAGRFIKSEFTQKLNFQFSGDVYRVALLLDGSPDQLEVLRGTMLRDVRHRDLSVRRFGGGVMGMGVLICVLYLVLNWATRGYFQRNLRVGAFLVLIAGMLLLMMIS